MPRTMAYARCGLAHVVLVHTAETPADAEWQLYMKELERWLPDLVGILVVTPGGGPTSSQRRQTTALIQRTGMHRVRTAIVSDSLLARGIVNALALASRQIKSFRPEAIQDALTYIGAGLHTDEVLAEIEHLRRRLVS